MQRSHSPDISTEKRSPSPGHMDQDSQSQSRATGQLAANKPKEPTITTRDMLNQKAILDPQYTTVQKVEVAMQRDKYIADAMQENGVNAPMDAQTKEMHEKLEQYRNAPEEKLNEEYVKLTIHKQRQQINTLTDANRALQAHSIDNKEMGELLRIEARTKLAKLLEKFSIIEKLAPQIPKQK